MTSPFGSDSSSSNASAQQNQPGSEEFSIRTMKEDLENPQKFLQSQKETAAPEPLRPIAEKPATQAVPAAPQTSRPLSENVPRPAAPQPQAQTPNPFSAEIKPDMAKKYFEQPPLQSSSIPTPPPAPKPAQQAIVELPVQQSASSGSKKILIIAIFALLIISVLGLGGYYFWSAKTTVEIPVQTPPEEQPAITEEVPVVINPAMEKYSSDKPNYLTLDIATLTSDEIKAKIIATANEIKEKSAIVPNEFIVVDANNNPVAFPIFATAVKLNLSPILLESLRETFSLYLYNDTGNVRLAIETSVKDKNTVTAELLNQEATFVTAASFLFLDSNAPISSGKFSDNNYNGTPTRYINLDLQTLLSIDYAITDSKLIIATSKSTLRAVLDKLAANVSGSAIQQTPTTTTEPSTEMPTNLVGDTTTAVPSATPVDTAPQTTTLPASSQ